MNIALVILATLFILIYGGLAVVAIRRPLLARLAAREALRRPGQSALFVVGLMIAGASMMAGLVLADSSEASITANALQEWGRVDLTVTAGGQYFSREVAVRLANDTEVSRNTAGIQEGVETLAGVADLDQRLAKSAVRVIGFDPASQPSFGAYVLTDGRRTFGTDLPPEAVLLSSNLAKDLEARVGDRLQLLASGTGSERPSELVVAGIARPEGPGAYGLLPAVFVTLETLRPLIGTEQINVVRLSAKGNGDAELEAGRQLAASVDKVIGGLSTGAAPTVREVKARDLAVAQRTGANNRAFYLGLTFLVIVAAASLAVNLAIALADERRPRLALLRALGLTRRGLMLASILEGAAYSLAAGIVSSIPGIIAGILLVGNFRHLGQGAMPEAAYNVVLAVKPTTVTIGVIAGSLITLGALFAAGWRTSRMTIVAAIRNLPEPPAVAGRWLRVIAVAALLLVGIPAVAAGAHQIRLVGGVALIVLAVMLTRRILPERLRVSVAGAAFAAWGFVMAVQSLYGAFPFLELLVAVGGLSLVATASLSLLDAAINVLPPVSGKRNAILRPPFAYLSRRPLRTGLTTLAFAILLMVIVMLAVFMAAQSTYAREAIRYQVAVAMPGTSALDLPPQVQSDVIESVAVRTGIYTGPLSATGNTSENSFIRLYTFSDADLRAKPLPLFGRADQFKSDDAVWQAVRRDPGWIVTDRANPGQVLTLIGRDGPVRLRVAGEQLPGQLDGIVGSSRALSAIEKGDEGRTVLLRLRSGADAKSVAREIQRSAFPRPVDASPTSEMLEDFLQGGRTFINSVQLLLDLGLLTGVLTVGILALRAVVERRYAIGLLRGIGYRRRDLVTGLVAEEGTVTALGIVIGIAAGAFLGLLFMRIGYAEAPYRIDWPLVGSSVGLIFATLAVITIAPALRIANLPPAQALRITE